MTIQNEDIVEDLKARVAKMLEADPTINPNALGEAAATCHSDFADLYRAANEPDRQMMLEEWLGYYRGCPIVGDKAVTK
jgi:hypothetical protein